MRHTTIAGAAALVAACCLAVPSAAQDRRPLERFTAFAVNMGNVGPVWTATVEIAVTRWSSAAERDRLTATLLDHGPEALVDALRDIASVGYIRTPTSLAYDLRYALSIPGDDGGRRVILVTDRPIGVWEAARQPRSIDYPFTLIELRLNTDGEGEGKLSIATRITADKEHARIELEDYASQPVRLLAVRAVDDGR